MESSIDKGKEIKALRAIGDEPGQYFVLNKITQGLFKKGLIWFDSGGYMRLTESGRVELAQDKTETVKK
jgi:hypothetical protein